MVEIIPLVKLRPISICSLGIVYLRDMFEHDEHVPGYVVLSSSQLGATERDELT